MNRKRSTAIAATMVSLVAILIGFIAGAIFLVIAGLSPIEVYGKLIDSVFGKPKFLVWTLMYASPIMLTGLSVAFSFKTGVFNIGAEGQFVVGAMTATVLGIALKLPAGLHAIVCLLGAAAAGFVWSMIVGIMKVKRGIHEVLSFIMFNWIAFYLSNYVVNIPYIHKEDGGEASKDVLDGARILFSDNILKATDCTGANWGIVIAVVLAIVVWIILEKTTLGYNLKAVGANRHAAEYGGINANRSVLIALGISGALSGLGGAVQILGIGGRLAQYAGQEGYGFEGISVALIGSTSPLGCIFSAFFYGAMKYGGTKLTLVNAPAEIVNIIMGCVVFVIAIQSVFMPLLRSLIKKVGGKEE